MANPFLPDDFEVPDTSAGYMKFKQGENKFRVLTPAILGSETWIVDQEGKRKPLRFRQDQAVPVEKVGEDGIKFFMAFAVWNYQEEKVQILEITQKGIMKSLRALSRDTDWGNPMEYDLVVTREGEGFDTTYYVNPKPTKELEKKIKETFEEMTINLEALYDGKDPFASTEIDEVLDVE